MRVNMQDVIVTVITAAMPVWVAVMAYLERPARRVRKPEHLITMGGLAKTYYGIAIAVSIVFFAISTLPNHNPATRVGSLNIRLSIWLGAVIVVLYLFSYFCSGWYIDIRTAGICYRNLLRKKGEVAYREIQNVIFDGRRHLLVYGRDPMVPLIVLPIERCRDEVVDAFRKNQIKVQFRDDLSDFTLRFNWFYLGMDLVVMAMTTLLIVLGIRFREPAATLLVCILGGFFALELIDQRIYRVRVCHRQITERKIFRREKAIAFDQVSRAVYDDNEIKPGIVLLDRDGRRLLLIEKKLSNYYLFDIVAHAEGWIKEVK
ncbi:MAG: hypothetical protein ACI39G_00635 [Pseudoramibacter sp.]